MSLANIYPYFRTRMKGLGFNEHEDGFNRDNIPRSLINKSFHLLTPNVIGGPVNQNAQHIVTSVSVSYIILGYRYPTEAKEKAMLELERIIKDICNITNRTATFSLLNVVYEGSTMEALNAGDDNQVIVDIDFSAEMVLNISELT